MWSKILITGYPKEGKTTFLEELIENNDVSDYKILKSEDYEDMDYKEQLYWLMDQVTGEEKWIIEGIQGIRFLRKYVQKQRWDLKPDIVYFFFGPVKKKHERFVKGLNTIFSEYLQSEPHLPPIEMKHGFA